MPDTAIQTKLLADLTEDQGKAVRSTKRRVLVVAGAGSGKTEVMARRVAWWVAIEAVPKEQIVAFTFTERAAEEMKFRIRTWIQRITPGGEEVSLGNMFIGTIHGFCLAKLREYWPDDYHNFDILDEAGRTALILRGFNGLLGLKALKDALSVGKTFPVGRYDTLEQFAQAYDQLHEHAQFEMQLPSSVAPYMLGEEERDWCKEARLLTNVGTDDVAKAFAVSAARYYAYLRCRRFLDFSTSQSELVGRLSKDSAKRSQLIETKVHLVVDEVQDINPVQHQLIDLLIAGEGHLTAVGDHRQSIYGFRGAKVEILGRMWKDFGNAQDAEVIDLQHNFRSTPRVIDLANRWAETISTLSGMRTPSMLHGNTRRLDHHASHVSLISFDEREEEADWIAEAIKALVPSEAEGALHDKRDGSDQGIALSDIAVLVRSSTDVRTYMEALEAAGVPSIVRAGPDLFSQPEVLFLVAALVLSAGGGDFYGSPFDPKSLPNRIRDVLGCDPNADAVLKAAARVIRKTGLALSRNVEERVDFAAKALHERIATGKTLNRTQVGVLRSRDLQDFLTSTRALRRVFPQRIYHVLLSEAEVEKWDTGKERGQTAMFHLGVLSGLITGIETPGWTSAKDYQWQIIGLCQYGAQEGRAPEQPLMVQPDAVNISTIHAVKGLEFAAVFLADVRAQRFPSSRAKQKVKLPLSGNILKEIDVDGLSDNDNHDGERRLMYVALTRSERFLCVSYCGNKKSRFIRGTPKKRNDPGIPGLEQLITDSGGVVTSDKQWLLRELRHAPKTHDQDNRLATSFSDLRYYIECPHDFYLRKVLGFAPTIDQAFGYGRGVHNLMRAVHADPKKWAVLATDPAALKIELQKLVDRGLFYLRYTVGDPADNMRSKGMRIIASYVARYAAELQSLEFEPEKEFETLIEYPDGKGGALISGAIDLIRQDDPPRVTLIDFKSGNQQADAKKLDEDEMRLQVGLYALAARTELEYQPERGLVRYLDPDSDEKAQLDVPLDSKSLDGARIFVATTAQSIRQREFMTGPRKERDGKPRCPDCDFFSFCGMPEALKLKP